MTEQKLEQVRERIAKDYKPLVEEYLKKEKIEIINDAYRLAHYNEIVDFFDNVDYEYPPFDEEIFDRILNYEGNVILKVWESWLDYSHPERFNFFCYEDLTDIICWEFKN